VPRFLIDANLPYRWDIWLGDQFRHVFDLGDALPDRAIWEHARLGDLVIVTKDTDFSDWVMLADPPPRVVHFRTGNLRLREFKALVVRVWPIVADLITNHKLVIVLPDTIESIS
jgi:predicted nuclease of predicted toxin-antitoxin system